MSDAPPLLTVDLLEALRERWAERGLSIDGELYPGLSDGELDAVEVQIGRPLGTELRCWWGWHNGVARTSSTPLPKRAPGPLWLPVEAALQNAAEWVLSEEGYEDEYRSWSTDWLPVTWNISGGVLACETAMPIGEPARVTYIQAGVNDIPPGVTAASLGQIVTWWTELYDRGLYYLDTSIGRWRLDESDRGSFPGPAELRSHHATG